MTDVIHKFFIIITDEDIDHLSHVNNASYISWLQSAVIDHWNLYASPEMKSKYLWIALRHEIDYIKEALRTDTLIAELAIKKVKKVRITYQSTIKRNGVLIAKALSTWCCVHSKTKRPIKIGDDVLATFNVQNFRV